MWVISGGVDHGVAMLDNSRAVLTLVNGFRFFMRVASRRGKGKLDFTEFSSSPHRRFMKGAEDSFAFGLTHYENES
jgi:hypothetical protein